MANAISSIKQYPYNFVDEVIQGKMALILSTPGLRAGSWATFYRITNSYQENSEEKSEFIEDPASIKFHGFFEKMPSITAPVALAQIFLPA
jgi:hypothetical protein